MIFCVEDDNNIRDLLVYTLETTGFHARGLEDSQELWKALAEEEPELILLDIMLPGEDGYSILEKLKKSSGTRDIPIIMVTAKEAEFDKVRALEAGADDYITKPFSMPILIRKIAAVLRRSTMKPNQEHQTISYKNLILDLDSYSASINGETHELTQREFEILRELLLNQGRVLTRKNLLERLWKYDFYGDERVVDTHIKNLRKKLGIDFIQTIRGVGYKIDKEK